MAEINANFVVEPIDLTIVQEDPGITITPETISLNVYAAGYAPPGGDNLTLQFNDNGKLGGAPNTAVSNGNISFGNIGNVKITGGTNGYFLQTDGSGNLTWAQGTANVSGNGTADGANGLIQLSDGTGNFRSGSGFSFDTGTNALAVPGDVVSAGDFNGVDGNFSGNITANFGNYTGNVSADYFIGNLIGSISDANFANYAGNVTVSSQPNITSVGTLISLSVTGAFSSNTVGASELNISGNSITDNLQANGTIVANGNVTGNYILGNGAFLDGIDTAGISNGTSNLKIATANGNITATVGNQPNIMIITSNSVLTTSLQTNSLRTNDVSIALGNLAGNSGQGIQSVAIGQSAGETDQGTQAVAIGPSAGDLNQGNSAVAIGHAAALTNQGDYSIAIGYYAGSDGSNYQHTNSIILNATAANLPSDGANRFFVKPIRNANTANILFYNETSGEITFGLYDGNANVANTANTANFANFAGNVTVNSQPNITSVGTLTSLTVTGNVSSNNFIGKLANGTSNISIPVANSDIKLNCGNTSNVELTVANGLVIIDGGLWANKGNVILANVTGTNANFTTVKGNGSGLSSLTGANVTGQVGNALIAGTVYTNAQPNITSVGNLTDLRIDSNNIHLGINAGNAAQGANAIAIGRNAGWVSQGILSIAIGQDAAQQSQGQNSIAIGEDAAINAQGNFSLSLGYQSGYETQGANSIAIGTEAAKNNQSTHAIAIGFNSGRDVQGSNSIAIGYAAGYNAQSNTSIAIGKNAGSNSQGLNAIAIGNAAGYPNSQANNSIVLNATGASLNAPTANALFIKPIRTVNSTAGLNALYYDSTTGEIVVYVP